MPDIALNMLPEHGISVHVLGRQASEELVTHAIRGEEDYFSSALHLKKGLVLHNEVDLVDCLEVSGANWAPVM